MKSNPPVISGAVEGIVDEAVLRRLIAFVGAVPGPIFGKNGKEHLLKRVQGYNQAARFSRWVILIDLDQDDDCAPPYRSRRLSNSAPYMCFRVAVREIEAWLLADREHIAQFLSVPLSRVPHDPDAIPDPKGMVVHLARHSRKRDIHEDMVPRLGSSLRIGPAYASRLIEFVQEGVSGWRPDVAAGLSDSLRRCIRCLQHLAASDIQNDQGSVTRNAP